MAELVSRLKRLPVSPCASGICSFAGSVKPNISITLIEVFYRLSGLEICDGVGKEDPSATLGISPAGTAARKTAQDAPHDSRRDAGATGTAEDPRRAGAGGLYCYALNLCPKFFSFLDDFPRGRQARAEAQLLKASPGLKAGAPTVHRKRRVNSIAACRAVPRESPAPIRPRPEEFSAILGQEAHL